MAEANTYGSDELLFAGLKAGSERAFDAFYQRYFTSVLYFSRRYVEQSDAEDIAAEAFVQTWEARSGLDTFANLTSYLYVVARNKCHDVLRRQQVRTHHAASIARYGQEKCVLKGVV